MFKKIKDKILNKYFEYDIVGEYFDDRGDGHLYKKYIKKYHFKSKKKRGVSR